MEYGRGVGSSKKVAKSRAARYELILIFMRFLKSIIQFLILLIVA